MKFLLDMGISIHLVPELRSDGHEAAHIVDLSTGRLPDAEILSRARAENQVLLVHDLDFPALMAASGSRSPSVIVFRLRNMRPENVLAYLRRTLVKSRDALEQGAASQSCKSPVASFVTISREGHLLEVFSREESHP